MSITNSINFVYSNNIYETFVFFPVFFGKFLVNRDLYPCAFQTESSIFFSPMGTLSSGVDRDVKCRGEIPFGI